jgi:hypothetical protein
MDMDERLRLELDPQGLYGAAEIAAWLETVIDIEGSDRPAFKMIAGYILSDINDAMAKTREQEL